MTPFQRSTGAVILINLKLLFGCSLLFLAWACWPPSAKWWGFGLLSILVALSGLGLLGQALADILKLRARERMLAAYLAQGNKPKSSRTASDEALQSAGMR